MNNENETWGDAFRWLLTPLKWLLKRKDGNGESLYVSLLNPISLTLLVIMLASFVLGLAMVFNAKFVGFILLLVAGWIATGFDYPESSPKRVWLLTIFGQKTTVKSYGLTLLLSPFIGKVEISLLKVDHNFPLTKQVVCTKRGSTSRDGNRLIEGYIDGIISVSIVPDDKDDPDTVPADQWKSGGQKLRDFDNVGQIKGVTEQLDDVLTAWVQEIADTESIDMLWMETNGPAIANILVPYLLDLEDKDISALRANNPRIPMDINIKGIETAHINDARGLGVTFNKFNVVLKPADSKVIEARNRFAIEEAQRAAQLLNTKTMNQKIIERAKLYREGVKDAAGNVIIPPDPKPESMAEIRAGLIQEDLVDDGKATLIMNKDGLTVAQAKIQ